MNPVAIEPAPEYSEEYYDHLARTMGEEKAAWARRFGGAKPGLTARPILTP